MKHICLLLSALFLIACSSGNVGKYKLKVVAQYPHDTLAYTQGLFFRNGKMYESTGLYGRSSFREVDLESGKVLRGKNFSRDYFMEGSVVLNGTLYILTWKNGEAFKYDADSMKFLQAYSYPREGWGLTTDGTNLVASDGSSRIFFMDGDFKVLRQIKVTMNGRPVRYLNELEWIDGRIWANIYTTDDIVIINPRSGKVEGIVDCSGLLPDSLRTTQTDVLNGIAVNDGKTYLTGKNWPCLYQVEIIRIK